ncbi:MAG: hypothetical protein CM1200mP12_18540 [Gammaproteobacteria bacterium]|nr:MAG: hypothetical protein CM1200mP12_18540 [Gammaproteobacteria bacterium]
MNASSAYARGSTGSGIVIGVTDSGLDTTHVEIGSLKTAPGSQLSYSNYTPNTRQKRHGTMVSGIAAGLRNGSNYSYTHGVAFDAKVFFVAIQLAEPDPDYDPIDLGDSSGDNSPDYSGVDNFFGNYLIFSNLIMLTLLTTAMGIQEILMTIMKYK